MIYQFKIVPIDRANGLPAFEAEDVGPQIVVDIDGFYRVMSAVNPAPAIPEEADKLTCVKSLARAFGEMFGADVYYRPERSAEPWERVSAMRGGDALGNQIRSDMIANPAQPQMIMVPLDEQIIEWETSLEFRLERGRYCQGLADQYQIPVMVIKEKREQLTEADYLARFFPAPRA